MTEELFEHIKRIKPGVTAVPMYLIRRPLGWSGDERVANGRKNATEENDPAGSHADDGRKYATEGEIEK